MSNKSMFKPKKQKSEPIPRSLKEIQEAYAAACGTAGEIQYRIENDKARLNQINYTIQGLNNEAAARNQLDAKTPKSQPEQTTEALDVQS